MESGRDVVWWDGEKRTRDGARESTHPVAVPLPASTLLAICVSRRVASDLVEHSCRQSKGTLSSFTAFVVRIRSEAVARVRRVEGAGTGSAGPYKRKTRTNELEAQTRPKRR